MSAVVWALTAMVAVLIPLAAGEADARRNRRQTARSKESK